MKVYLLALTEASPIEGRQRFSAYTMERGVLKAIWPRNPNGTKTKLPGGMIYTLSRRFPAFHFCLNGWGYSKAQEIATSLARFFGETVEIYTLDHGDPSWRCTIEPLGDERRNPDALPRIVERIEVFGRRWFSRANGHSTFSAEILVNDQHVCTVREDGYGAYYLQRSWDWLARNSYVNPGKYGYGGLETPRTYCDREGIFFRSSVHDVGSKRQLAAGTSNQLDGYGT